MNWEIDKQAITKRYFENININNIELFGIIKENLNELYEVFPLIKFIISRLETVSTLTVNNHLWDAEIVLRSALETLIKFVFITTAKGEERSKRIDEYWNLLSEINSIKQSMQAKKSLEFFGNSEIHRLAYSKLILPDDLEQKLREKWPKSNRQRLEQKWSFSEIVLSISKENKGTPFEMLIALAHSYRISSHIMHGDETGVLIIDERDSRTKAEQDKANAGHYLRLMSDCSAYSTIVAIETMNFLDFQDKKKFFYENQNKLNDIQILVEKYHGKVFDDPDYDKFRSKNTHEKHGKTR